MFAATADAAIGQLRAALQAGLPPPISRAGVGSIARAEPAAWQRVVLVLAVYFAAAALALLFFSAGPVLVAVPALVAGLALGLLHVWQPPSQLWVWGEGESGAGQARFQAWQLFPGLARERVQVPIPAQLASSARPCDPQLPLRLTYDAGRGQVVSAEFETRLFRQVALCYAGSFPMARAVAVSPAVAGAREVRNAGGTAWPAGTLLSAGRVHGLPALAAGARAALPAPDDAGPDDAVLRTALERTGAEGTAALWPLDLAGVADAPVQSRGWLLVSVPTP